MIPRILSIAEDLPGVNLALSLHAPTQELRCQIVPTAKAYPLNKLMVALNSYQTIRFHLQVSELFLSSYFLFSVSQSGASFFRFCGCRNRHLSSTLVSRLVVIGDLDVHLLQRYPSSSVWDLCGKCLLLAV